MPFQPSKQFRNLTLLVVPESACKGFVLSNPRSRLRTALALDQFLQLEPVTLLRVLRAVAEERDVLGLLESLRAESVAA